jgi:hypothetical protein
MKEPEKATEFNFSHKNQMFLLVKLIGKCQSIFIYIILILMAWASKMKEPEKATEFNFSHKNLWFLLVKLIGKCQSMFIDTILI